MLATYERGSGHYDEIQTMKAQIFVFWSLRSWDTKIPCKFFFLNEHGDAIHICLNCVCSKV